MYVATWERNLVLQDGQLHYLIIGEIVMQFEASEINNTLYSYADLIKKQYVTSYRICQDILLLLTFIIFTFSCNKLQPTNY